eukprot:SM000023S07562  [mRNA]  locus=s23:174039:176385:+ [translate_table: standard]
MAGPPQAGEQQPQQQPQPQPQQQEQPEELDQAHQAESEHEHQELLKVGAAAGPTTELLSVGFNQDHGCFACGTSSGFRIYNCEPVKETFRREFPSNGGIALVEMLFRCNILAIVGGGESPRYPPNKVMIWDDHQSRCIGELSFRSEVRAVRLRRDRIVVVLEHKIYVYNFADLKLLHQIETIANSKGLCALSPATSSTVLACPGLHKGQLRVELYDTKKTRFISAHDSALACFALTLDGSRLATASVKGTLIRVFDTANGTKLQELRRGADRAEIYSLSFSPTAQWLALSSDKGTVHVFALKSGPEDAAQGRHGDSQGGAGASPSGGHKSDMGFGGGSPGGSPLSPGGNPGSTFSFLKGVLPKYFSSEWSFAQYRLSEETKSIVAFGPQKHTLIIVGIDGSFYKCSFDPINGGEMVQEEVYKFMKPDDDMDEGP